ncbi:50S ribosomal protein L10 [archaeon]|nr:50S ribosomal protein L10 [archaeon]
MSKKISPALQRKQQIVRMLIESLKDYKNILLLGFEGVTSAQFRRFRELARGRAYVKVAKNTLIYRALKELFPDDIVQKAKIVLKGQTAVVATNENPFAVLRLIEETKEKGFLRAGMRSPVEITIPAGNTGLPPGPDIALFAELGIPTRIISGTIWVVGEHTIVKPGEEVTHTLAELLMRLGVKPLEKRFSVKGGIVDNVFIPGDLLGKKPEEYCEDLRAAAENALRLAYGIKYVVPQIVPLLLQEALSDALRLAYGISYPAPQVLPMLLQKAMQHALALKQRVEGKEQQKS